MLIWLRAGVGLVALSLSKRLRRHRLSVLGLLLCSFPCTCPGFYFRRHNFILLLPAVALLASLGLTGIGQLLARLKLGRAGNVTVALLGLALLGVTLYRQKDLLSTTDPNALSRQTYGDNPFPESAEIAAYVKAHTSDRDTVAVLGSEPQILFYAHRRSATGYIYTYALMEPHPYALDMQKERIQQIEKAEPKFLIFVNVSTWWLAGPGSNTLIFNRFQKNQDKLYRLVGAIDIVAEGRTLYRWDEKGFEYKPVSDSWIAVFERRNPG